MRRYSITEMVDHVGELQHELIREALMLLKLHGGIEITSISDVPSKGTGLGSSSTYTVALLHALYAYTGRHVGAERLARETCDIEIERCGKPIGKQDQYIAAFGGLQFIQFNPDESVFVDPIICGADTKRRLQERLLMLYTGVTRSADGVLAEQSSNTRRDSAKRLQLRRMTQLAGDLRTALNRDDLDGFGEILHEGWVMKRELASGITQLGDRRMVRHRAALRRGRRQAAWRRRRRLFAAVRAGRAPRVDHRRPAGAAADAVSLRAAGQQDHLCRGQEECVETEKADDHAAVPA